MFKNKTKKDINKRTREMKSFPSPSSIQESYIKQRLLVMEKITKDQREEVKTFVGDYLKRDGCFVLRMAAKNSSDLIASELICELWDKYRASCKMDERNTKNSRLSLSFEEKNSTLRRREEAAMAAIDPKYWGFKAT